MVSMEGIWGFFARAEPENWAEANPSHWDREEGEVHPASLWTGGHVVKVEFQEDYGGKNFRIKGAEKL